MCAAAAEYDEEGLEEDLHIVRERPVVHVVEIESPIHLEIGLGSARPIVAGSFAGLAGLAALFPGLAAHDCRTLAELDAALATTRAASGPVVIGVELEEVEVPPFAVFRAVNSQVRGQRSEEAKDHEHVEPGVARGH